MPKNNIIILISIFFTNIFAMDFYIHENNSKTLNAILGKGIIEYNDVEKLDNFLKNLPRKKHTAIYLDSPGGSLIGGIRLGKYFKDNRIKTVIQGYKVCASACALAFLGGTDYKGNKWMSSTTKSLLGFHAFYNADGTKYANTDDIQQTVALILEYGKYINAPIDILIKSFSTPSNKMYWLSIQEELRLGIKVWDIDNKKFIKNYNYSNKTGYAKKSSISSNKYIPAIEFVKEYFTNLKKVPFMVTWNMLSNSLKNSISFSAYKRWWGKQVKKVEIINITSVNQKSVKIKLKFFKYNGKIYCSQDILNLIRNGSSWLIDKQLSKTVLCK